MMYKTYYCCPIKILQKNKNMADFICEVSPFSLDFCRQNKINPTMGKSIHFSGQPLYSQVIKLLDKSKILQTSRKHGGEHYVKRFDVWTHLVVMLYAVIMRFDSLREIMASLQAEARKLCHLGITTMPSRSTLSDANKRRPEIIFESIYRDLYTTYRNVLSSDSRKNREPVWMKRLQIIDSTTITLFSNLLFKGVGRHPKTGKKKGGIKVHTVIHANEGVPSEIKFTSAATNDSFMLRPSTLSKGEIVTVIPSVLMMIFPQETVTLLGASETLQPIAVEYLLWFVPSWLFQVWVTISLFIIRLDGSPRLAMFCSLVTALVNIVLDWIFIFPLGWGIMGLHLPHQ